MLKRNDEYLKVTLSLSKYPYLLCKKDVKNFSKFVDRCVKNYLVYKSEWAYAFKSFSGHDYDYQEVCKKIYVSFSTKSCFYRRFNYHSSDIDDYECLKKQCFEDYTAEVKRIIDIVNYDWLNDDA